MELPIEFEKAASALNNYIRTRQVSFETPEEDVENTRRDFQVAFSPGKLLSLSDAELLNAIFPNASGTNQSLCYQLEYNAKLKRYFGSISGGSAFKYGLFQKQEDKNWMTGAPANQTVLSVDDALALGKQIRDCLTKGYEIIDESDLRSVQDYIMLDEALRSELGQYSMYSWFQKYYFLFFPEKLVGWYTEAWLKHLLLGFSITPESQYYVQSGQLALLRNLTGLSTMHFQEICYKVFGEVKRFFRLGSSDDTANYADEWHSKGVAAIGWNELKDLINYLRSGALDKGSLVGEMQKLYYRDDKRTASRKAGEVKTFYETKADDVFVVASGESLIGFVDNLSPYYYDANEPLSHIKKGTWRFPFQEGERLPLLEGLQTTCFEIRKPENLMFLYNKYYNLLGDAVFSTNPNDNDNENDSTEDIMNSDVKRDLPDRMPRQSTRHPMNAILYGAPGTGKTYALSEYAMAIIEDRDVRETPLTPEERVALLTVYKDKAKIGQVVFTTFHQSYSYEDFIQGLRPVPKSETMKFFMADGVFKRIADRAMHDFDNYYVIVIDEINRANISKVFGELITLIETDKRWGEANELSLTLPSGDIFAIPNNLYIVGTMNSADKSISLIDTALRRRFDFVEMAPNASLVENPVLQQVLKKLNEELLEELDSTDLLIGHAYFIGKTESELVNIMNRSIIPLLYEYFFDNSKKVKTVVSKAIETLEYRIESENVGRIKIAKKE